MKLILFDIDGTLLYNPDMGPRKRFEHAIEKVHGVKLTIDWENFEGVIDNQVIVASLKKTSVPEEQITARLLEVHDAAFEYFAERVSKEEYQKMRLPGAVELLSKIRNKVHVGVLTGNYEKTAWHKLALVGLREYFEFGVFGHEAIDRNDMAKKVFAKAKKHFGKEFSPHDIIIVGDTPRDIACARIIDAEVVAVATGKYTKEELKKYKPDLLVTSLEDPKVLKFLRRKN